MPRFLSSRGWDRKPVTYERPAAYVLGDGPKRSAILLRTIAT